MKLLQWARLKRLLDWASSARAMARVSVFAAALLALALNILAHRFYRRWDVTPGQLYSLAPATLETLSRIDQPLEVIVLLAETDLLTPTVRQTLLEYSGRTPWLKTRYVDPDRTPAEFVAVQTRYGLFERDGQSGTLKSPASIVLSKDEASWFISAADVVAVDPAAGRVQSRLEQALTEGLRNLTERKARQVCFSKGHEEIPLEQGSNRGLIEFKESLEHNNFQAKEVSLAEARELEACELLVVAGPRLALPRAHVAQLERFFSAGHDLLLLLDPVFDRDGQVTRTGLEEFLTSAGVELTPDVVLERDQELTVPLGKLGEVFLATPKSHVLTLPLAADGEAKARVMVRLARSLRIPDPGRATAVLVSSAAAVSIPRLTDHSVAEVVAAGTAAPAGGFVIAAALEKPALPEQKRGARLVVLGSTSPASAESFREPALFANRLFIESTASWLTEAAPLVSIPEKPEAQLLLNLTEASLAEVQRYVLLYMPGTALLIGFLVLRRRRALVRQARARAPGSSRTRPPETPRADGEGES